MLPTLIFYSLSYASSEGFFNNRWRNNNNPKSGGNDLINEGGYSDGYGGPRGDGSGLLNNSGGNAQGHIGDTGIGTVVVTQDVLHKGDGKVYTSDESLRKVLAGGSTKSLEQQIEEMQESALLDEKKSVEAGKKAAEYESKSRALTAQLKKEKAKMLMKAHENINKVLTSHKEELVKDIIPTVAVTPHSLGFITHDRVALERLNQVRKAAFMEGMSQKKNVLLHENSQSLNPIQDVKSDPQLIRSLFENAPINKKSTIVDPTKGRFSIMNDKMRKSLDSHHPIGKKSRRKGYSAAAYSASSASGTAFGGIGHIFGGFSPITDNGGPIMDSPIVGGPILPPPPLLPSLPVPMPLTGGSIHPGLHGFEGTSY